MFYAFGDVELDLGQVELRRGGGAVPVEPQVFALLVLLVENHDRMVSRDEIVEGIWEGRFVSEAAISSRVKAARRAVGDDGSAQRIIRTVHGRGFRCVAEVRTVAGEAASLSATGPEMPLASRQPSIAVLPFAQAPGGPALYASLGEAVPHDIIAALSRQRWLKVISRGSSFRFREANPDIAEVGRALDVRYCLTGDVGVDDRSVSVSVELSDTGDGSVVWSERFNAGLAEIHEVRAAITGSVAAALEMRVPVNEARLAQLSEPGSLDAWGLYHLGLQRMFRFSSTDNAAARANFLAALQRDPGFARAHAGLSFTQFQDAYLGYGADREASVAAARQSAEAGVGLDPLDPFANFTLGRSFWLSGDIEASLGWFDRARTLSPSYAQGVYARAWAATMLGRPEEARGDLEVATLLSPLDPFLYAMKGTRALSYLLEDRVAEALPWIEDAARTPGANAIVHLVAAATHEMSGDKIAAAGWVSRARLRNPDLSLAGFFQALPFANAALRARLAAALGRHGLASS
jgi:TolB-like protein